MRGTSIPMFLAAIMSLSPAAGVTEPSTVTFDALLHEAAMAFKCGEGYREVQPVENDVMPYEKALRTDDDLVELRFAIRPLSRITIDYEDPHSAAPEPEHLFPMLFQSLTGSMSGGRHSPHREFRAEDARERFNADWASLAVFDIVPEFKPGDYSQAFLVAMHGSGRADAYTVVLFNDYQQAKAAINEGMECLVFAPRQTDSETAAASSDG